MAPSTSRTSGTEFAKPTTTATAGDKADGNKDPLAGSCFNATAHALGGLLLLGGLVSAHSLRTRGARQWVRSSDCL